MNHHCIGRTIVFQIKTDQVFLKKYNDRRRLNNLSIISIKNTRTQQLNVEEIIDKVSQKKACKVNFNIMNLF